jgi:acyl-ACP thioesterase
MDNSVLTETHTVATFQVDFDCKITIPGVLMLLQDIAWQHANQHNFGYEHLRKQGLFWVLLRMHIEMLRYPRWTEALRIETWSKQPDTLAAYRDFEGRDADGNKLFAATSSWVILNRETNRPQPLTRFLDAFPHNLVRYAIAEKPAKIPALQNATTVANATVQPSDIDMHLHVNNTRYVQWVIDSFGYDFLQRNALRTLDVNFRSQAKADDPYTIMTSAIDDKTYASSIVHRETEKEWARIKTGW